MAEASPEAGTVRRLLIEFKGTVADDRKRLTGASEHETAIEQTITAELNRTLASWFGPPTVTFVFDVTPNASSWRGCVLFETSEASSPATVGFAAHQVETSVARAIRAQEQLADLAGGSMVVSTSLDDGPAVAPPTGALALPAMLLASLALVLSTATLLYVLLSNG